jgi:hypothetical protein
LSSRSAKIIPDRTASETGSRRHKLCRIYSKIYRLSCPGCTVGDSRLAALQRLGGKTQLSASQWTVIVGIRALLPFS